VPEFYSGEAYKKKEGNIDLYLRWETKTLVGREYRRQKVYPERVTKQLMTISFPPTKRTNRENLIGREVRFAKESEEQDVWIEGLPGGPDHWRGKRLEKFCPLETGQNGEREDRQGTKERVGRVCEAGRALQEIKRGNLLV